MRYLLFFLCFNVFAQSNSIYIDQVGSSNQISVSQSGSGHSATLTLGKDSSLDTSNVSVTQQGSGARSEEHTSELQSH